MAEVFSCLRSCNVALRWLLLHTAALQRKLRSAVGSAAPPPQAMLTLLLDTALLEFEVGVLILIVFLSIVVWRAVR
jgi:hypothetical protein